MNKTLLGLGALAALIAVFFLTGGTSWFDGGRAGDPDVEADSDHVEGGVDGDTAKTEQAPPVLFTSGTKRVGKGGLAGQLKWFVGQKPGADLQVALSGSDRRGKPIEMTARTDARGAFSLNFVPSADDLTLHVAVGTDDARTLRDIAIEPDAITGLGEIWLGQGGLLEGRVQDLDGAPIAGATVRVHAGFGTMMEAIKSLQDIFRNLDQPPEALHEAQTDAQGHFEVPNVSPGEIALVASAAGFESVVESVTMTRDGAVDPIVLGLAPGVPLRGDVVTKSGRGVAGARVVLLQQNGFTAGFLGRTFATTDETGAFEMMAPPGGANSLGVMVAAQDFPPSLFEVEATAKRHRFQIEGGATLHMRLLEARTNKPLAQADVLLFLGNEGASDDMPKNLVTVVTDDAGTFECFARPGQIQMLWIKHADIGQQIYAKGMGGGEASVALDDPVLRAGMNRRTVRVSAAARVFGVVKSKEGAPIPGVRLRAMGGFGLATDVLSDAEGRYECRVQARAMSAIIATAPGWIQEMGNPLTKPPVEGEPYEYDIVMTPAVRVRGRVLNEAGEGLAGVRVSLATSLERFSMASMFSGKARALTGPDGSYLLDQAPAGQKLRVLARRAGFVAGQSAEFETGTSETTSAPDVKLGTGVKVKVTVVDETGDAVPYAQIEVDPTPKDGPRYDPMDELMGDDTQRATAAGVLRLEAMPVGSLQLTATAGGFAETRTKHEIEDTSRPLQFELVMRRAVPVRGRVTDQDGQPVKGANVQCGTHGDEDLTQWIPRIGTTTDADGAFTLEGVPDVPLDVSVSAESHRDATVKVFAANRDQVDVRIVRRDESVQRDIAAAEKKIQALYAEYMNADDARKKDLMAQVRQLQQEIARLKGEVADASAIEDE